MSKKTLGRQKIEMVKMTKETNLQVTFSKRRAGLFKKASELSTLCGADVAVVVFSPGKKAFSFGNPNVDTIIHRFLTQNNISSPTSTSVQLIEAHRNANVHDLNVQLMQVLSELEMEKKRGKELAQIRKINKQAGCWWEAPIEELNLSQLEQLKASLEELKKNVIKEAQKLVFRPPINPHPQYLATCSSNGVPPPFNTNVPNFEP